MVGSIFVGSIFKKDLVNSEVDLIFSPVVYGAFVFILIGNVFFSGSLVQKCCKAIRSFPN